MQFQGPCRRRQLAERPNVSRDREIVQLPIREYISDPRSRPDRQQHGSGSIAPRSDKKNVEIGPGSKKLHLH